MRSKNSTHSLKTFPTVLAGKLLSVVAVLSLEDRGIGTDLGVGETNRKLCLLILLLHLRTDECHSDSKSNSRGAEMIEESHFMRFFVLIRHRDILLSDNGHMSKHA